MKKQINWNYYCFKRKGCTLKKFIKKALKLVGTYMLTLLLSLVVFIFIGPIREYYLWVFLIFVGILEFILIAIYIGIYGRERILEKREN